MSTPEQPTVSHQSWKQWEGKGEGPTWAASGGVTCRVQGRREPTLQFPTFLQKPQREAKN